MRLYCQCGYPIRVAGNWNGQEYRLRLYDGEQGAQDEPITQCPRCGEDVQPGELQWLAPVTQPALQRERPLDGTNPNKEEPLKEEHPS